MESEDVSSQSDNEDSGENETDSDESDRENQNNVEEELVSSSNALQAKSYPNDHDSWKFENKNVAEVT